MKKENLRADPMNPVRIKFGVMLISNIPSGPGVFWFRDKQQKIIYVSKTTDLKTRLMSYSLLIPERCRPKRRDF